VIQMRNAQLDLIERRLPSSLAGVAVNKARIKQQMKMPDPPRLLLGVLSDGTKVSGKADQRRFIYHPENGYDDRYLGSIKRDTLSLFIDGYDLNQVREMMSDLQLYLDSRELDLVWSNDRMRLAEVFNPQEHSEGKDSRSNKPLYRISIDLWIEYEFLWLDNTPSIQSFNYWINSNDKIAFNAQIYAPGSYGASLKLIRR
jgi:hypothetical protein